MKSVFKLILILLVISASLSLEAQSDKIRIILKQPPPNLMGVANLWDLSLENTTNENLAIYLSGTVSEEKDGIVIEGRSKQFTIKPGRSNYKYNDFPNAEIKYNNGKYKEIILRTGNAPEGSYTICVTAYSEAGEVVGRENCILQVIQPSGRITLISPIDGAEFDPPAPIRFVWLPLQNTDHYSLKLVELKGNESPETAIKENRPILNKEGIKITSYQYEQTDPKLEAGKRYVWNVTATVNNTIISTSIPSGFAINTHSTIPLDTSVLVPQYTTPCDTATNWDFETGDLCGWRAYGEAFENQPTYGNNIASRVPGLRLNQNLQYSIGTFENRHDLSSPEGGTQGDEPMGTLISKKFVINTNYIHFLLGGGRDERRLKVELLIKVTGLESTLRLEEELRRADPGMTGSGSQIKIIERDTFIVVSKRSGNNSERMMRSNFSTSVFRGFTARISIVDSSSVNWGHLNVDDFRFTDNLPGDIWVTGMEITQATQTPDNEIPLIGYKKTAVRVYVQSGENGNGPWENVNAELTVSNISGVHGSTPISSRTFRAVNGSYGLITLSERDTNRNNIEHSYLFILENEHTAPGQRKLEFRVLPPSGSLGTRPESNPDNDTISKVIRFESTIYYSVYGLLWSSRFDRPTFSMALPFSAFEPHRKYTENVFPLSQFTVMPYLDNAVNPPTFDSLQDVRRWAGRIAADNPAPRGLPRIRFYGLHPYFECPCGLTTNFSEGHNQMGFPGEGEVMAHELGHGLGRGHPLSVGYKDSAGGIRDPAYGNWDSLTPSWTGAIMRQYGFKTYGGYEAIPPVKWRGWDTTYDFMAYARLQWVSPFTYCKLMHTLSRGRIGCPSGIERSSIDDPSDFGEFTRRMNGDNSKTSAGELPGQFYSYKPIDIPEYLYISGKLNPDGTAIFYPFESFDHKTDDVLEPEEKHYKIVYEDKNGKIINEFPFEPEIYDSRSALQSVFFGLALPYDKNTERIKLFRDDKEIAVKTRSSNTPLLDISSLSSLSELKGKQTLSWSGTDGDGDQLIYSVDYSTDNGNTWMPVKVFLSSPTAEIDADFLPGTSQGSLRISVSDGFNTSSQSLTRVISVSKKNPEITMLPVVKNEKDMMPLVAEANAFDPEDGAITDELSYSWISSKDGNIGKGHWVVLSNLTPGKHILTLTVTDSDGNKSSSSTEATIQDRTK